MLSEVEDHQHNIFATAFIEELDSAVSTSSGIGTINAFGSSAYGGSGVQFNYYRHK